MTLEGSSPAIIILILFMIIALAVSYVYGWKMIEMTGWFGSQVLVATIINLFLWTCAIFGWFLYAWGVNEELFYGGLVLGAILLIVSEAALVITLFIRRDKLLGVYHEQEDHSILPDQES